MRGQIIGNLNTRVIPPSGAFAMQVVVERLVASYAHLTVSYCPCVRNVCLRVCSEQILSLSLSALHVPRARTGPFDVEPLQDIADLICTEGALPLIKHLSEV